jgi:hypothetical protein
MKRLALFACCLLTFACGEDPEHEGRSDERAPNHLGVSRGDELGTESAPGSDDDDDEDGDAQVCSPGTSDETRGTSASRSPAAPGGGAPAVTPTPPCVEETGGQQPGNR